MKLQNMKIFTIVLFAVLLGLKAEAQQDPMYTQYMYNTMSVNPAYAGSREALSIMGLMRMQWLGITGAPRTQTLAIHSPVFSNNMGLGLSVVNDKLGFEQNTMLYGNYSYSIKTTKNAKLSFGLKVGLDMYKLDLTNSIHHQGGDDQAAGVKDNTYIPNFGFGVYYHSHKGYVGISAPKLLEKELNTKSIKALQRRHYFLIGGYVFDLNDNLKFKPAFLAKAVEGAPIEFDLSANMLINDKLGVGLAYRTGDAISGLLQYYITPQFRLGYAYDFTLTELRHDNSGSHELMLSYDFLYANENKIRSPRFF